MIAYSFKKDLMSAPVLGGTPNAKLITDNNSKLPIQLGILSVLFVSAFMQ